jgi:hypothetical protein
LTFDSLAVAMANGSGISSGEPSRGPRVAPEEPLPAAWPDDSFRSRCGSGPADLVDGGFVAAQWRLIALLQMLRASGVTITPDDLARRIGRHPASSRYTRLLDGLRAAGYLRKSGGCSLTKRGQAVAAWPQKLVSRECALKVEAPLPSLAKCHRPTYAPIQKALLHQIQGLKARADASGIRLSRRQHDALDELADTLAAIHQRGSGAIPESLDGRYWRAVQCAVRLRFDQHPEMTAVFGPLIDEWITSRRGLGDKEWLREARQGLEKGVRRGHGWEMRNESRGPGREILIAHEIQQAIRAQYLAGAQRVRWSGILIQLIEKGLLPPQSLENFTKWVVRHLGDLLDELPPRRLAGSKTV